LEFLGRTDHQVKIRGFRIELGEVEAVLTKHPAVTQAVALAVDGPGGARLTAFAQVSEDSSPGLSLELTVWLADRLPSYMMPSSIQVLPSLPLNSSGKVDRKSLAALAMEPPRREGRSPRPGFEAALADLFSEILGVDGVSAEDDFFTLGGHSLLAVQLAAGVERDLGRDLPLAQILAAPSVEALARYLDPAQDQQEAGRGLLVPLTEGGPEAQGAAPLFLVHPVGGTVFCYRRLAELLARPVVGIQARGLDGREPPLTSIDAMAELYLEQARSVHPGGPWTLGGWSLGGVVAFEMARRLRAAGEDVAPVVLIDSWLPSGATPMGVPPEPSAEVRAEAEDRELAAFLLHLGLPAEKKEEVRRAVHGNGAWHEAWEGDSAAGQRLGTVFEAFQSHARALRGYEPRRLVAGEPPVVLFQAVDGEGNAERAADGWRRVLGPAMVVMDFPGNHFSLLRGETVELLAEEVRRHWQSTVRVP
jgi:thioesterase domain-containing protein/acyl carrier protein